MTTYKSDAIQTSLVNTSVTHDHIRYKQAFVSSCAQKQIKWPPTGMQRIKDHVSITSAGFSKQKMTMFIHCSLCLAESCVLSISRTSVEYKCSKWAYHEASEQVQEAAGQLVLPPHWT